MTPKTKQHKVKRSRLYHSKHTTTRLKCAQLIKIHDHKVNILVLYNVIWMNLVLDFYILDVIGKYIIYPKFKLQLPLGL